MRLVRNERPNDRFVVVYFCCKCSKLGNFFLYCLLSTRSLLSIMSSIVYVCVCTSMYTHMGLSGFFSISLPDPHPPLGMTVNDMSFYSVYVAWNHLLQLHRVLVINSEQTPQLLSFGDAVLAVCLLPVSSLLSLIHIRLSVSVEEIHWSSTLDSG